MRHLIMSALAAAALSTMLPQVASAARFQDPSLATASPLVEQAACRTVKTRTYVRGRVVYKTVRKCGLPVVRPTYHAQNCSTVKTRVRTSAGKYVFKTVRRCR